jgi:hypothetical protein
MTSTAVAQTILKQIPASLHMALGIRDKRYDATSITFKITGTRTVWCEIKLNDADLYDIRCYTTRKFEQTTRYEISNAYADQMVEILDRMDRGQIEL